MTLCVLFPGEVEAESEEEDDDDDDCKKGSMDEVRVELIKFPSRDGVQCAKLPL